MPGLRDDILRTAKMHQYSVHPGAVRVVTNYVSSFAEEHQQDVLAAFFKAATHTPSSDRLISAEMAEKCIQWLMNAPDNKTGTSIPEIVPVEKMPMVQIDETKLTYTVASQLTPEAKTRNFALRQRYFFALSRCLRNPRYFRHSASSTSNSSSIPLLSVLSLEGIKRDLYIGVLGYLRGESLPAGGSSYKLEDPQGIIALNFSSFLSQKGWPTSVVCVGSIVVAEGFWTGSELLVQNVSMPAAEPRDTSLSFSNRLDMFGLQPEDLASAHQLEKSLVGSVIIFLAHVHLDKPQTVQYLTRMFTEFQSRGEDELASITFVLTGDFHSSRAQLTRDILHHADEGEKISAHFDTLATLIHQTAPTVASTAHFVFIPGAIDPTPSGNTIPQLPLLTSHTAALRRRCPHSVFAPNPCRLRFHSQEIIVCRSDFTRTFLTDNIAVVDPSTSKEQPFDRVVRTVLDQGHLFPTSSSSNIRWKDDHCLRVFPLPDLLVLCDGSEQWECMYQGCRVLNPGIFSLNSTFLWYTPADGEYLFNSIV